MGPRVCLYFRLKVFICVVIPIELSVKNGH